MELQHLRYFLAVVDEGGFTKAAAACGVAQPTLSQQIGRLEQQLGRPLFDRLPRRVVLTEAGRQLIDHARTVVAALQDAERHVRDAGGHIAGPLAVGVIPTIAPYLLPPVADAFLRAYPQIELTMDEDITERLLDKLAAGALDLVIASTPIVREHVHVEALFDEPLLLVMSRQHPLATRKRLKWSAVRDARFLVMGEMHCLGAQVLGFCDQRGIEPHVVLRGAQLATIQRLVAAGVGLSLVPAMAAKADRTKRLIYRELGGLKPTRTITLAWHLLRYRTNAARAFEAMVKQERAAYRV